MSANKRTFEVDRFLTRELLLRNPDNTNPSVNQVLFTDGDGGTYLAPINPGIPTTGFNQITLVDSNAAFEANQRFNNLNIKEGLGVKISKQNINSQDYLTFQVTSLVPSTFNAIKTQDGSALLADSVSTTINIIAYDGVNVKASTNNSLYIGGTPAFGIINLSTSQGLETLTPSTSLSSVTIQAGFGIQLQKTGIASYSIGNLASTYALNQINIASQSTLKFTNTFNQLTLSTAGNTQLQVTNSTLTIGNYAFSNIRFPPGQRFEASTNNNSLILATGYGITYSSVNGALQIGTSLPSSFSVISTSRGIISATSPENILTLNAGYGIDYVVSSQALTIKLASTFVSQISTETGVVTATNQSILNMRQGRSIIYSTSSDNMLYINSKDYNRVNIIDGRSNLITTSMFASLTNKTFSFIQGAGINIIGDTSTNKILFEPISAVYVSGPQYAFTYVQVYSTPSYLGEDLTDFEYTQTINSAPNPQANLGIAPVFPLQSQTDVVNNILYVAIDQSSLLYSTNQQLSSLNSIVSSYQMSYSTIGIVALSISSVILQANQQTVSTLSVGPSLVITSNPDNSSLIVAAEISSVYAEVQRLCPSTIGSQLPTRNPLMTFNYISSQVGVNLGQEQPEATLHVGGTVLAQNFATYSDSRLKNLQSVYTVSPEDLDQLKPWSYTYISDSSHDVGFRAEDVEKILPSAVKRGQNGLLMVDYGRLSVVSLAALRDTNQRLTNIESTLASLTRA